MFAFLSRWFGGRDRALSGGGVNGQSIPDRPAIPRYPPYDDGFPAVHTDELLESQARLITAIDHEMGMPADDFEKYVRPILSNYAAFVHLLPASKAHHHRGPGGLFRHGLEVANHALKSYHGRIIDGHESGQRRKELEFRWRIAVLAAALGHDLGKPAIDMTIFDRNGKKQWDVFSTTIVEWMDVQKVDRYYIRWTPNRVNGMHENLSVSLLPRVVPAAVFDFLKRGDPKVISTLYSVLSGTVNTSAGRVISELVHKADQASVAADLKGQRIAEEDTSLGVPAARFIVDAMKRLVSDGQWKPNQPKQPLWVSPDAAFIDWDMAVPQINRLLDADDSPGVPRTADAMAQSLVDYDVLEECIQDDDYPGLYVRVAPEPLSNSKTVHSVSCVRLKRIDLFFDGPAPAPVKCHVGAREIEARKEMNKERASEQNQQALKRATQRDSKREVPFKVVDPAPQPIPQDDTDSSRPDPAPERSETSAESKSDAETIAQSEGSTSFSTGDAPLPAARDDAPEDSQNALRWYNALPSSKQILLKDHILTTEWMFRVGDNLCLAHPEFIKSIPKELVPNGITDLNDWLTPNSVDRWSLIHRNIEGHKRALMFKEAISDVIESIRLRPNLLGDGDAMTPPKGRQKNAKGSAPKQSQEVVNTQQKQPKATRTPLPMNSAYMELAPKLQVLFKHIAGVSGELEAIVRDEDGAWMSHDDLVAFTAEHHPDIPERFLRLQLSSSPLLKSRSTNGIRQISIWEEL